jgi:hypothetical protein
MMTAFCHMLFESGSGVTAPTARTPGCEATRSTTRLKKSACAGSSLYFAEGRPTAAVKT